MPTLEEKREMSDTSMMFKVIKELEKKIIMCTYNSLAAVIID